MNFHPKSPPRLRPNRCDTPSCRCQARVSGYCLKCERVKRADQQPSCMRHLIPNLIRPFATGPGVLFDLGRDRARLASGVHPSISNLKQIRTDGKRT